MTDISLPSHLSHYVHCDQTYKQKGLANDSVVVLHMAPGTPVASVQTSPPGGLSALLLGDGSGNKAGGGGAAASSAMHRGPSDKVEGADSESGGGDDDDDSSPPAYSMLDRALRASRDFQPVSPMEKMFQVSIRTMFLVLDHVACVGAYRLFCSCHSMFEI